MSRGSKGARSGRGSADPPGLTLDLRGVRCPLNWARAKIQLEQMQRGDVLLLLLDDARGVRDIPGAAEACGYVAGETQELENYWRLPIVV